MSYALISRLLLVSYDIFVHFVRYFRNQFCSICAFQKSVGVFSESQALRLQDALYSIRHTGTRGDEVAVVTPEDVVDALLRYNTCCNNVVAPLLYPRPLATLYFISLLGLQRGKAQTKRTLTASATIMDGHKILTHTLSPPRS